MGFLQELDEHHEVMASLRALAPDVERIATQMREALAGGGTVWWFGNGGSAAQAQHFACELLVVPIARTSHVQEAHQFLGHLLCSQVESGTATKDRA